MSEIPLKIADTADIDALVARHPSLKIGSYPIEEETKGAGSRTVGPLNPKPETRNLKPETRNLKPETQNPEPQGAQVPAHLWRAREGHTHSYRGASLTRNRPTLEPCSRSMPRAAWWS
jgi:hypothetical protein